MIKHAISNTLSQIRRFAVQRNLPNQDVVILVHDRKFLIPNPRHSVIARSLLQTGLWEAEVTQYLTSIIQSGQTVVDVGAHIGYYTVLFANLVGSAGQVIACEPESAAQFYLRNNINSNSLNQVQFQPVALYDRLSEYDVSGRGKLTIGSHGGGSEIRTVVFDDQRDNWGISKVHLVKVDVEGAEWHVLRGMEKTILRDRPVLVIEIHPEYMLSFGSSADQLAHQLLDWDYQLQPIDKSEVNFHQGNITVCAVAQ